MKSVRRSSFLLAISLTALAGYIDALGFLHIGGYFVSFMSGNSTRLAVHLMQGNYSAIFFLVEIIGSFVVGAMLGILIGHAAGHRQRSAILAGVSAMLLLASLASEFNWPNVAVFCMTLAMGAVNAVFQKDGKVVVAVTYMTGTLVQVGQKIAFALLGGDRYGWLPPLILWIGLVTGGFAGAFSYSRLGLHGVWLATLFSFCMVAVNYRHRYGEGDYL
jgi:uncharacterized membrane protein YoaK (UPF0700 family)